MTHNAEKERLVRALEDLAREWEAPENECGEAAFHRENPDWVADFERDLGMPLAKHYPVDPRGAVGCDGCPAAIAADEVRSEHAAQLRALLATPFPPEGGAA